MYIILIIALVFVFFAIKNYFFSEKARIIRQLKKAAYKKIAKVNDNDVVKIVGNVALIEKPLIAPLSNRECSHYYVKIEQKVSSGKSSHWKTVIEDEVTSKFLIRDENSFALINDNNTKSYIIQDRNYSSGFMDDATNRLKEYLRKYDFESEGLLGLNKRLRYHEGVLENGEEIAVFGKGVWKDAMELNLPKKYGKVLEITSQDDVAIYLSDDPETTLKKVNINKKVNLEKEVKSEKKEKTEKKVKRKNTYKRSAGGYLK